MTGNGDSQTLYSPSPKPESRGVAAKNEVLQTSSKSRGINDDDCITHRRCSPRDTNFAPLDEIFGMREEKEFQWKGESHPAEEST